ncbi:hypothetical protein LM599_02440 [Candidatus Acetothermia bacterium]|nr:hypothetical protein [Candidatus Acetothermia bacterium]MCI2427466.1 hypothetical protein [Candidatus Acetothermia bacterium]MCI2428853.1 hypothetical protein [Candidatus Acetothermia bacterium]
MAVVLLVGRSLLRITKIGENGEHGMLTTKSPRRTAELILSEIVLFYAKIATSVLGMVRIGYTVFLWEGKNSPISSGGGFLFLRSSFGGFFGNNRFTMGKSEENQKT